MKNHYFGMKGSGQGVRIFEQKFKINKNGNIESKEDAADRRWQL
ncbi:MAG: hypothetical protein H6R34_719 [Bacteroidetes bacterium]|nr:hypothetical protein [Bacteroidota bacterium]